MAVREVAPFTPRMWAQLQESMRRGPSKEFADKIRRRAAALSNDKFENFEI